MKKFFIYPLLVGGFLFFAAASGVAANLPSPPDDEGNDMTLLDLPGTAIPADYFQNGGPLKKTDVDAALEKRWFRNVGEWTASRTVRAGIPTEPTAKLITNGKRFDVTLGKRIPIINWAENGISEGWSAGADGGMMASLTHLKRNGQEIFATETFDGFFGANITRAEGGWIWMLRVGHLSAHLVDNSPYIGRSEIYNQFWTELTYGQNFLPPEAKNNWDLYSQISLGVTHNSSPAAHQPRAQFGLSYAYHFNGPDSLAFILSGDILHTSVFNQKAHYNGFVGVGRINTPNVTHRPYRVGISTFRGSDHRNQFYRNKENFTTFEIQTEF